MSPSAICSSRLFCQPPPPRLYRLLSAAHVSTSAKPNTSREKFFPLPLSCFFLFFQGLVERRERKKKKAPEEYRGDVRGSFNQGEMGRHNLVSFSSMNFAQMDSCCLSGPGVTHRGRLTATEKKRRGVEQAEGGEGKNERGRCVGGFRLADRLTVCQVDERVD